MFKTTLQSRFLDKYNLLFTYIVHGHTVTSTNTPVPLARTLSCLNYIPYESQFAKLDAAHYTSHTYMVLKYIQLHKSSLP
jgi:hypothetical protein